MGKGRIAPMRPSIARFLKRKIGGFVKEYERELNRAAEPASQKETEEKPAPAKPQPPDQPA